MDDRDLVIQLMMDTHEAVGEIRESVAEIKTDLKHHLPRIEKLEKKVAQFDKDRYKIIGAFSLLSIISLLFNLNKYLPK